MKTFKMVFMSIPIALSLVSCNSGGNAPGNSDNTAIKINPFQFVSFHLPEIKGKAIKSGKLELPATSLSFITFADAGNSSVK